MMNEEQYKNTTTEKICKNVLIFSRSGRIYARSNKKARHCSKLSALGNKFWERVTSSPAPGNGLTVK
jgi:hypothetical protein